MVPQPVSSARGAGPGGERPGSPGGVRRGVRVVPRGDRVQALEPRRGGRPDGELHPGGGDRVDLVQALEPRRGGQPVRELPPGGGDRVVLGDPVHALKPR